MGKAIMFLLFMWFSITITGNVMQGSVAMSATRLTSDITDVSTVIPVTSTAGFPETGVIQIGTERIAYAATSATSFTGALAKPIVRGAEGTIAADHNARAIARTVENSMLNQAAAYEVAVITQSDGAWAAITIPMAVMRLLGSFMVAPLAFLGTDLQMLAYLWILIALGIIIAIAVALAGGRRV